MGKLFVIIVFTLALCGITRSLAPGVMNHAFFLGNFSVNWMMLCALGYCFAGFKLVAK